VLIYREDLYKITTQEEHYHSPCHIIFYKL